MTIDVDMNGHDSLENGHEIDASSRPPGLMSVTTSMPQPLEDVWVQNKTGDGKYYYYNARTRESSWTKPEGTSIRIVTQEDIEQMAAQNTKTQIQSKEDGKGDKQCEQDSNDQNKVKNTDNKESTNFYDNQIDANRSQTSASSSPYSGTATGSGPGSSSPYTGQTPSATAATPVPSNFFTPPPGMPPMFAPPFMPPPGLASMMPPPGMGFPPAGGFPPGFPPFGVPPFGMPPFGMMPPHMQAFQKPKTIDEKMRELRGHYDDDTLRQIREVEEQLAKLREECAAYTEHETPEGKKYYYNTKSNESTWDRPKCFSAIPDSEARLETLKKKKIDRQAPKASEPKFEELSEEEKAKQRSKPVSSTPVTGTPWCVVWTRDGRVFFYNASEHTSLWERPLMLLGRTDVDKMVNEPPKEVELLNNKAATAASTTATTAAKTSNLTQQVSTISIKKKLTSEPPQSSEAASSSEPPLKKNRTSSSDIGSPSTIQDADTENSNDSKANEPSATTPTPAKTTKEAAMEAELKAARERAQIPLEQRLKQFRDMLVEREVSAFSTWEKELHKIVFDPRYLLLTSKERKLCFEKYIKERADEERKEKAEQIKRKKDTFRELLKEACVQSGKQSFTEFASRYCKDERFKQIEKMKERESLFNEYLSDMRKKEKDDKYSEKEKLKRDYLSLLKEHKGLHYGSSWTETKRRIEDDSRYRAVESSSRREDWFRDYVRSLPALNESTTSGGGGGGDHANPSSQNDREEGEEDGEERESERRKEKEKQERIEASIKEREKEVKEQLSKYQSEREKERDQLKRDESIECFKALLIDLVKNFDLNWKETKKLLKRDTRYDFCRLLSKDDKETLYTEHIKMLKNKKKSQFYALLDETVGVGLNSTWKEVKRLLKADPRYEKLTQLSDLKLDKEFDNYISDKYQRAKNEFRQLLKETKLITYKSFSMVQESEQHLKDIEDILTNDKCYTVLECAPEERKKILIEYMEQLDRSGPPPPPTATIASTRKN